MKCITYIFTILSISLFSCALPAGTINLEGRVTDKKTKKPVPDRCIIVKGMVGKKNNYTFTDAGTFSTDSMGFFKYKLRKIKNAQSYTFYLVGDSDYTYKSEQLSLTYLKKNSDNITFSIDRLASLTMVIIRKCKSPPCDTLLLSWKTDGIDGRTLFPYNIKNNAITSTSDLRWIGGEVRSIIKTRTFADERTEIRWVLFRNGKKDEFIDTITCRRYLENNVSLIY